MNRLLQVAGTFALIAIGLYFGVAVLNVGVDILDELFRWLRYRFLPGAIWTVVIGAVLWVLWGLVSRNGRLS